VADVVRLTFSHHNLELRRSGVAVPLQRQPALVLSCLLGHPGQVVGRDELARFVWPEGHHVEVDQSLRYCVRQIRLALQDDAAAPRYIETLPRKGYRWIGPDGLTVSEARTLHTWAHDWHRTAAVSVMALGLGVGIGQPAMVRLLHLAAHAAAPISLQVAVEAAIDTIHGFLTP